MCLSACVMSILSDWIVFLVICLYNLIIGFSFKINVDFSEAS